MSVDQDPILRPAARALMVDEANRILLIRFEDAVKGTRWWATPGGALKPDESHEQAVKREIYEETGLAEVEIGPWIWRREHIFETKGRIYRQQDRFFVVRIRGFTPVAAHLEPDEAEFVRELRWWTASDLDETTETLSPRMLPRLLRELLEHGPPTKVFDVGV